MKMAVSDFPDECEQCHAHVAALVFEEDTGLMRVSNKDNEADG